MKILAVFAHPDDETMLAGGILALLASAGAEVHYLCATRGEGGEAGEPPLCERDELGDLREQEMVCAVGELRGRSLTFLGYTDPLVGPDNQLFPYTEDLTLLAGQIDASMRQFGIEAVITHGSNGEYGHPAHVVTHQAALAAVQAFAITDPHKPTPSLYTVQPCFAGHPKPHLANPDDTADLVVDIESALERKVAAALCHKSQNALFVRRASQEAGRTLTVADVIVKTESLHRALPPVTDGLADDRLAGLLRPFLQTPEDAAPAEEGKTPCRD